MRTRIIITAALGAIPAGGACAQGETFTFAEVGGQPLRLDFYEPLAGEGPAPLIIWIHGGGWRGGTRAGTGPTLGFREHGYAVASVDYRLTGQAGQWGSEPVVWPAQAHDVKAAVRWLRDNAEPLGVDPCAFIAWGSSAGGHLAAVLGTSNGDPFLEGGVGDHAAASSDVQLAVDYYGPSDLLLMNFDVTTPPGSMIDHDAVNSPESFLLGSEIHGHSVGDIRSHIGDPDAPWPALVSLARSAAPARLATDAASNVPMFIAHGEQDTSVAIGQSERLLDALTDAGTPAEMVRVPDAGHGLPGSVADLVRPWLDAQLEALPACGCVADLVPDGILDLADVTAFAAGFMAMDPIADLNGDGIFDLSDLGAFITAFIAGCG